PVLHPLVEQLLADERLAAYADALPASARVSEPVLPLVLAGLHEHLGRRLVVLLPEDADARDAAEAARWLLGAERVALLPGGGVVDGFPTAGRDPRRFELFGDEIEAVRAFSPFTQRALHDVDHAVIYPAAERRLDLTEPSLEDETAIPSDLVPVLDRPVDLV